jgi:4-hydroxybenzoate polyprenyltransferase
MFDSRPVDLNYFLALSRTPHALLDLAAPGLAALLCLGSFPSPAVIVIGIITAFAGYTAVYALNDIVDYQVDRKTCLDHAACTSIRDLDSLFVRHPLAQGLIGYREALTWTFFWATLAIIGAWWLNPFCLLIFLIAALLEIVYCSLLKITWLRSLVSGLVKTSGPIAAVFAVNPEPPSLFLLTMFLWFFFWEIGGQNVPNDLTDMDMDRDLEAKTIPVRFGIRASTLIINLSLVIAYVLNIALIFLLPDDLNWIYLASAIVCGIYFLIIPALVLHLSNDTKKAFPLFNRASYYPLALLLIFAVSLLFH